MITKLKKSNYNIEVDTLASGDILLYNTLTSAFCILHKANIELYRKIEFVSVNSENIETVNVINTLKDSGFVIDEDIDEYQYLQFWGNNERFNSKTLGLTIAPTLDCNMACPYCYEDKNEKVMDEVTIKAIISFAQKRLIDNQYKHLHINFLDPGNV